MRIFKVAYHGEGSPLSGVYFYSEASAEMFMTKYFSVRAYRACNVPDYWVTECEWTEVHLANLQQEIWKYPIWCAALEVIPNHFAHVSEDDPNMIAFTASVEHGIADRQTRMRPGKYLARFYTDMEPKKVAYYAEWWRTGTKPRSGPVGELQFASTPDEIEHVYEVGPYSCMYGKDSVRVYGAGDLAIANILYGDKVLSRALCWPDKKVFGRIYPNTCDWQRDGADSENDAQNRVDDLMTRFMDMGWTSTSAGGDALFTGARLLKIRCGGGDYLMPYSDHGGVRDGGSHWVMDYHNAEHSCQQTSGLLLEEEEEDPESGRATGRRSNWR